MAIRFPCPTCRKAIEVDDEHAGQAAQCPYCTQVVEVPRESQLTPAPVARPAGESRYPAAPAGGTAWDAPVAPVGTQPQAAPAPSDSYTRAPGTERNAARRWGLVSVALGVFACLTFAAALVAVIMIYFEVARESPDALTSFGPAEMQRLQELLLERPAAQLAILSAWLGVAGAAVGLAFGIASLRRTRRDNPAGWIGTLLCGGCVLCICTGVLTSAVSIPAA